MKALNEFKCFNEAKLTLQEKINTAIYFDIELNLEDKYCYDGISIEWELRGSEFMYSEEAYLLGTFEDCEMYKVNSCTGSKCIVVFDKANKVEGHAYD